jgi:catechol 2,3-dioxygenase-like lactoylglutathione lyase family enzyme
MALVAGINHLLVQVSDLDRSETFYRDVFGLDLVGRDLVAEEGPNSLLKTNSGHMILLLQVASVTPFRPNSMSIHHAFYLTPEQYLAAQERRRAAGEDVGDTRASFRAKGQWSFDVFDPDGHRYQVQAVGPGANELLKADQGQVACGKVEDFAVGSVTHFREAQFFLVRQAEGFLALSHWCTHMNGVLRWREPHHSFYCPFHAATFNRKGEFTGHQKSYPPLRLHPVSISAAGEVMVDTDRLIQRRTFEPAQVTAAECGATCLAAAR